MKGRIRPALLLAVFGMAVGCSGPGDGVRTPSRSQPQDVVGSPSPAGPGTVILEEHDYSYTPPGASPSSFQNYNGDAPIGIAVGTTVEMFATHKKPASSAPQILTPTGKHLTTPTGDAVVTFEASRAGAATLNAAGWCPSITSLPCVQPFSVSFNIS